MATNKKAISAYLPSDLEEYLIKYCTEYDITRKDKSGEIKPALGTAVVEILRIFFSDENVPSPLPDNVPLLPSNVVTEDRLTEALSEFPKTSKVVDTVPSNVLTKNDFDKLVEAAIADLKSDEEFLGAIARRARDLLAVEVKKNSAAVTEDGQNPTTQVDKASLVPIFEDIEDEPNKLLSTKEAFAIVKQRGYKSGDTAFAQWFRDNKGDSLHGIKKHRQRGKYIDVGL